MDEGLWKSGYDCMIEGKDLDAVMCWVDANEDNSHVICTRCFKDVVKFYQITRAKERHSRPGVRFGGGLQMMG
jgi:hypothetical protein